MKVSFVEATPDAEKLIVEIARVSSSRKDKAEEPHRLVSYLIRNKHWSPFEHGHMTVEIETSRGIAAQLLRHRSFTFQEFSQRYQDVNKISEDGIFEPIELREQAVTNRQSSTDVFNPMVKVPVPLTLHPEAKQKANKVVKEFLKLSNNLYDTLIDAGVAKECARFVLPLATKTKIYMTGTIRSWVHFLQLRDDGHAQKEAQLIAREIKAIFAEKFPDVYKALYVSQEKVKDMKEGTAKLTIKKGGIETTVELNLKDINSFTDVLKHAEKVEKKAGNVKSTDKAGKKQYIRLSKEQKSALKKDSKKLSSKELSAKYDVSLSTISRIL